MRQSPKFLLLFASPAAGGMRAGWQVQNLIDPLLECDQVAGDEFIAGAGEFVGKADIEKFRQAFVGIKAHPVPIGNRDQHEVEKLLQAGQSLVESLA